MYCDRSDRAAYKAMFDELQRVIQELTGSPLRFQVLTRGGTLLSIGVDMESAQALGAGDSFLPTNELVQAQTAEDIIVWIVRVCHVHVRRYACTFLAVYAHTEGYYHRGIHDFRHTLPPQEYSYVSSFLSLANDAEVEAFGKFCQEHSNPKLAGKLCPSSLPYDISGHHLMPTVIFVISVVEARKSE